MPDLPLFPALLSPVLEVLNYAGIAVFAASGALLAAQKKRDIVTFVFFAVTTGLGGGTVRDILLDVPVFWTGENLTVLICFLAALAVWLTPVRLWTGRALLWSDAVGLAAFATYGAAKGLAHGISPIPAFVMGVITACIGGVIRDVVANEPCIFMRPELYVTAAALASGLMVALSVGGVPANWAALIATAAGLSLRAAAIARGWQLPTYRR
jgi:uncharacterized membrane protein YeiH